jgi:DNA-binding transcriptional ArsR family regulator
LVGHRLPHSAQNSLEQAARLFKAISEVPRLRLVTLLSKGEASVSELAAAEGEAISTISQRLRILRNENVVLRRRRGKEIRYMLADRWILDLVSSAVNDSIHAPADRDKR